MTTDTPLEDDKAQKLRAKKLRLALGGLVLMFCVWRLMAWDSEESYINQVCAELVATKNIKTFAACDRKAIAAQVSAVQSLR